MSGKILRKILSAALAAAMITGAGAAGMVQDIGVGVSVSAAESGYLVDGDYSIEYRSDGTAVLTAYNGDKGTVSIPSKIKGYKITEIGEDAFKNNSTLKSVIIPDGVTKIGSCAFYLCENLTSITIPDTVRSFGNCVFSGCSSLKSITIPNGVTVIPDSFADGCQSLTSINIPESVTKIEEAAFYECTSLKTISVPDSVENIGRSAFHGTEWYYMQPDGVVYAGKVLYKYKGDMTENTKVVVKPGTKGIADFAFFTNGILSSITIPDSVKNIGEGAFNGSNVKNIVVSSGNTAYSSKDGVLYNKTMDTIVCCTSGIEGEFTVPSSVIAIGNYAFTESKDLTKIYLPNNLKSIGKSGFQGCYSITSINIPDSVTSIGENAFEFCTALKSISIPSKLKVIERETFSFCTSLKNVTIPENIKEIGYQAFYKCDNLKSVTILGNIVSIEPEALGYEEYFDGDSYYADRSEKVSGFKIYGIKGSDAQRYANENGFEFFSVLLNNNSSVSTRKVSLGGKVTVNCSSEGGSGGNKYAVLYKKSTDTKWATLQDYSTNKTVTFKPSKAVNYDIYVKVKDSSGTVSKKYFTVRVKDSPVNNSSVSATTVKAGSKVKAECNASGGTGGFTYSVFYKKTSDTQWACVQKYGSNSSVSITLKKPVSYDICIKAKDSSGTIVKKYFTVKATA